MWEFEYNGKTYLFNPRKDLTYSALSHIKAWYGELGRYLNLLQGWIYGDPDAVACVVWIVLRRENENPPEPNRFEDFSVGELLGSRVEKVDEPKKGKSVSPPPPTPEST
jgi:hypothetical protein